MRSFLLTVVVIVVFMAMLATFSKQTEFEATTAGLHIDAVAASYLDTPYSRMDCSKFVQTTYAEVGVILPRRSTEQYYASKTMRDTLGVLDRLVFFDTGWTSRVPNHVGIFTQQADSVYQSISKGVSKTPYSTYWRTKKWPHY